MSLFDPYSHSRLQELRQEQLSRKARRHQQLGLDREPERPITASIAATVRNLTVRLSHPRGGQATGRRAGQPALDS